MTRICLIPRRVENSTESSCRKLKVRYEGLYVLIQRLAAITSRREAAADVVNGEYHGL